MLKAWMSAYAAPAAIGVLAAAAAAGAALYLMKKQRSQREDGLLTGLFAAEPSLYAGLYTGLYRMSRGEWKAWQSWYRTFSRRTLKACPQLQGGRLMNAEPRSAQEAAQLAQRILRCAEAAGIELHTLERYPQERDFFLLDTGEDLPEDGDCRTIAPAFVRGGALVECGVASKAEP